MLEGDVEVRRDQAFGHQRDHVVDVRVRIDIVHPRPDAEAAETLREVQETRFVFGAAPGFRLVLDVQSVGGGILADDEEFLDARGDELFGFHQDVMDRA